MQDGDKIIFVDTAKVSRSGITNDGVFKTGGKKGTKVTIKIKNRRARVVEPSNNPR